MSRVHCLACAGSGQILGNGMIIADCKTCDGSGKVSEESVKKVAAAPVVDRRSVAYKDAIKDIQDSNPDLTKDDAVKLFDKAFVKRSKNG